MGRPIATFRERLNAEAKAEALASLSCTERLLAAVLVQLMEMQARRTRHELAVKLQSIGLSRSQAAAILGTTPQALAVMRQRHEHPKADAEIQSSEEGKAMTGATKEF